MGQVGNFISVASFFSTLVLSRVIVTLSPEDPISRRNYWKFDLLAMEAEFVLKYDPVMDDIIQVA